MEMLVKSWMILFILVRISQQEFIYRFTHIQCSSTGKSVKFLFCYPRTYDRKVFTVNIGIKILRPMDSMKVNFFDFDFFAFFKLFSTIFCNSWTSQLRRKTRQVPSIVCTQVEMKSIGVKQQNMQRRTNSSVV